MNATYLDSVQALPPATNLIPDVNVTVYDIKDKDGYWLGNIAGWIDIVGFKNMARIGSVDYIATTYEKGSIIKYNISYAFNKRCSQCFLDSMIKNISIISNRNITVWLNVTMRFYSIHWVWCGDGCEYPIYVLHTAYANFTDTDTAPKIFNTSASVEIYESRYINFTRTILNLNLSSAITKYYINSTEGNISAYLMVGRLEYSKKGVPFLNFSKFGVWTANGNISNIQNRISINGTPVNYTAIFYTPFGDANVTPIIHVEMLANKLDFPAMALVFRILLIVGIYVAGLVLIKKSVR